MKSFREQVQEFKRGVVLRAVLDAGCNLSEAARRLEIHRNTLDRLLVDLSISAAQLRKNWKSAEVMSEIMAKNKDLVNQYANSYCMGIVPGGITGERTCDKRIPVTEKYCEDCKKQSEMRSKTPSTGA
jgi:hypothetical protein